MKLNDLLRESDYTSLTDAQAATKINTPVNVKLTNATYTWTGLRNVFGDVIGTVRGNLMGAIELAKAGNDWATVGNLEDIITQLSIGVDFSLDQTQTQVDALVTAGVLTSAQGVAFKALGVKQESPAQKYSLSGVDSTAVATARTLNSTIDWFNGKTELIYEKLYNAEITTQQDVIDLL